MNYDLFISPAVVERAYVSTVSSERAPSGRALRHAGPDRTVSSGIKDVADSGPPIDEGSTQSATEMMERTVAALNDVFEQTNVGLRFRVDEATGDTIVSVIDRDTGDVLRQVPAEEILQMRQRLQELMGVLFDVTA